MATELRVSGDTWFVFSEAPARRQMNCREEEMDIFIHAGAEAPLKRIEVTPQTRVSEVVSEHGADEGALWREGADEAAAVEQTLAEIHKSIAAMEAEMR